MREKKLLVEWLLREENIMDISQEDLDAKLADASNKGKSEGISEKAAEIEEKIKEIEQEGKAKIESANKWAQTKVSEHAKELGELRKFREEADGKLKDHDSVRSELELLKSEKKKAEDAENKKREEEQRDPDKYLLSLNMTEEEAVKIDGLIKSMPDEVKKKFVNPAERNQSLVVALQSLRNHRLPETIENPAATWLKQRKQEAVNDPNSVREVMKELLKRDDKDKNRVSIGTGGFSFRQTTKETTPSALRFTTFREAADKKKGE